MGAMTFHRKGYETQQNCWTSPLPFRPKLQVHNYFEPNYWWAIKFIITSVHPSLRGRPRNSSLFTGKFFYQAQWFILCHWINHFIINKQFPPSLFQAVIFFHSSPAISFSQAHTFKPAHKLSQADTDCVWAWQILCEGPKLIFARTIPSLRTNINSYTFISS